MLRRSRWRDEENGPEREKAALWFLQTTADKRPNHTTSDGNLRSAYGEGILGLKDRGKKDSP